MEQITRLAGAARVGVDLAKSVCQVHAVDGSGKVQVSKQLSRDKFLAWCAQLPSGTVVRWKPAAGLTIGEGNSLRSVLR